MLQYEELFIKISDDFHSEVNPILLSLDESVSEHAFYKGKNIYNKLVLFQDILLNKSTGEISIEKAEQIERLIQIYKLKLKQYFDFYPLASCFIYYNAENRINVFSYFQQIRKYCLKYKYRSMSLGIYYVSLPVRGFPTDCSEKIICSIRKDTFNFRKQVQPETEPDTIMAKKMYHVNRKFSEHALIEKDFAIINNRKILTIQEKIEDEFLEFCKSVLDKNKTMFILFENIKQDLDAIKTSFTSVHDFQFNLYNTLINGGYIDCTLKKFIAIFSSNYTTTDSSRIRWIKEKYLLRYLKDNLQHHVKNVTFEWIQDRFRIESIHPERLSFEMRKATSKGRDL